jgi:type I restriction enzyme S subunit
MPDDSSQGLFALSEVPDGWDEVALDDLLIARDVRAATPELRGLPVLSLTKTRGLILQSERFAYRVAREDVSDYKVVRAGWLAYNPYVIWEGAIHVLRTPAAGLVSPVYEIWEPREGIDPLFIDQLVKAAWMLAMFHRLSTGAVRRRRSIKKTDFQRIGVALPPPDERELIVKALDTTRKTVDAARGSLAAAEGFKRSVSVHLVRYGDTPHRAVPYTSVVESEIGPVRADRKVVELGDLLREPLRNGHSARESPDGNGIPTLRLTAVTKDDFSRRNIKMTQADPSRVKNLWLQRGDIFIERANTRELVGTSAVYEGDADFAIFPDLLVRARVDEARADSKYVAEALMLPEVRTYFSTSAKGTADSMPKIDQTVISRALIPLPEPDEQRRVAEAIRTADRRVVSERQYLDAIASLEESLRDQLLSGTVRLTPTDDFS